MTFSLQILLSPGVKLAQAKKFFHVVLDRILYVHDFQMFLPGIVSNELHRNVGASYDLLGPNKGGVWIETPGPPMNIELKLQVDLPILYDMELHELVLDKERTLLVKEFNAGREGVISILRHSRTLP